MSLSRRKVTEPLHAVKPRLSIPVEAEGGEEHVGLIIVRAVGAGFVVAEPAVLQLEQCRLAKPVPQAQHDTVPLGVDTPAALALARSILISRAPNAEIPK